MPVLLTVLVAVAVVLSGMHAPLLASQRTSTGHVAFSSASVVCVQEALKLVACIAILLFRRRAAAFTLPWRGIALYAVPALMYAFTNNVVVVAQAFVGINSRSFCLIDK